MTFFSKGLPLRIDTKNARMLTLELDEKEICAEYDDEAVAVAVAVQAMRTLEIDVSHVLPKHAHYGAIIVDNSQ